MGGMELSRLMPMQQALLLARNNSDINSDVHKTSGTDTISATPDPASTDSVMPATLAAEEVAFEAPLRALETALAHIQCSDLANLETTTGGKPDPQFSCSDPGGNAALI